MRPGSVIVLWLLMGQAALAQGRFTPAGQLAVARANHTATLLRDGRVLVTGGRSTDGLLTLASCELYDPKKRSWSSAKSLSMARSHHTATLLEDGRVLVAGGTTHQETRFVSLDAVELYDPLKNTWTTAAPMHDARNGHTATAMPDGSVLVAGGSREGRVNLASVERFVPASGAWVVEQPLHVPRWLHAAVLLDNGAVLVLGGRSNFARGGVGPGISSDSVEWLDPAKGAWTAGPPMTEARQRMGALLLKGKGVVVIGGQTATSSTNLAETFAPGEPKWAPLENHLSMSLASHSATGLSSGDVLVIGGEPPDAVDTPRAQRWRHDTKQWCLAGELRSSRKGHTATLLPGDLVLVVGGTSSGVPEKGVELWQDAGAKAKCEEPPGLTLGW